MSKKRTIVSITIAFALAGVLLYGPISFYIETRHFTPGYVAWKYRGEPLPPMLELSQNLIRDKKRDDLVRGLTVEQVRAKFGDLRTKNFTDIQKLHEQHDAFKQHPHAWIGETQWIVNFDNGKATGLDLVKG